MSDVGVENGIRHPTAAKWDGCDSVRLAHQLNERCFDFFCELAEAMPAEVPPFVARNRDLWRRVDTDARRRLAAFPFVIVDMRFTDEAWWRMSSQAASHSSPASSSMPAGYEHLALEGLMFAWQVSRENRHVARMVFGMIPSVADHIATLTMQQIRMTAAHRMLALRVRWDDRPQFWRELLIAVVDGDEPALATLRHDAKLLFCGELVQRSRSKLAAT